jgi:hypothetical protein
LGHTIAPAGAVVRADVFDDGELELAARAPDAVADKFGLEAVEEGLGEGVVVVVADASGRGENTVVCERLQVVDAGVLGPAAGVMNQLQVGAGPALPERHRERVQDEIGTHVCRQLPADDHPAVHVEDEGEARVTRGYGRGNGPTMRETAWLSGGGGIRTTAPR